MAVWKRFGNTVKTAILAVSCLITLSVIGSACSGLKPIDLLNAVTPETGYSVQQGISYGTDSRQSMDLYRPTSAETGSVIVFVYGGAWRKGDKSEYTFVAQALASEGHTVVIPDYRLYPTVAFPDFITDVALSISALDDLELAWPGDSREIVIMGHSSGAHTAALLASDPSYLMLTEITVSALVAIAGPYDLPMSNAEVANVFGNVANPDSVKPVRLVTTGHPRTLLIHGADDKRVKPEHTQRYFRALEAKGVEVEKLLIDGAGHAQSIAGLAAPLDRFNPIKEAIVEFLN